MQGDGPMEYADQVAMYDAEAQAEYQCQQEFMDNNDWIEKAFYLYTGFSKDEGVKSQLAEYRGAILLNMPEIKSFLHNCPNCGISLPTAPYGDDLAKQMFLNDKFIMIMKLLEDNGYIDSDWFNEGMDRKIIDAIKIIISK